MSHVKVCFDFDGSKFVSSGDLLFVKYFIHQLSHCEFIQLQKCQRGVFQNHGVCGQAFPFLASPPPPRCFCLSEKHLGRAENPTETFATQARH